MKDERRKIRKDEDHFKDEDWKEVREIKPEVRRIHYIYFSTE